jgi:hypothetical protein
MSSRSIGLYWKNQISKGGRLVVVEKLKLADQVIPIWLIVYDQNPTKAYLCGSKEKVIASVEGAIRNTLMACSQLDVDTVCDSLLGQLKKMWRLRFISLNCHDLELFVHRLEIDKYHPVGRILLDCYATLDDGELRNKIESLFLDPSIFASD